jgi:quinol monooxygenase YgiN
MPDPLTIVHVHVRVKPDRVEDFRRITRENAENSVREAGVARFDVVQDTEDPTRFVLVEVYRETRAPAAHKETSHYLKWRDAAEVMMAEPRTARRYLSIFPDAAAW